jgi:hypothetical protein
MFFKADTQLSDHPKILAAGYKASWLFICGLCYSSRMLTDGFIPTAQVPRLAAMPGYRAAAARLVAVGLWEPTEGGYVIHDYLEYQESRSSVEQRRQADRLRKSGGDDAAALPVLRSRRVVISPSASTTTPVAFQTESMRNANRSAAESVVLDRDQDTDEISPAAAAPDHMEQLEGAPGAVPPMAARCAAIAEKARLAPHDEGDLAQVVQAHLTLWPEDVLADHAVRFDRWARQKEIQGEAVQRTPAALDTFFAHIRADSGTPKRVRPGQGRHGLPRTRASPVSLDTTPSAAPTDLGDLMAPEKTPARPPPPRGPGYIPGHGSRCPCGECRTVKRIAQQHRANCLCADCIRFGTYKALAVLRLQGGDAPASPTAM